MSECDREDHITTLDEFLASLEKSDVKKYESAKHRQFVEMFGNQISHWGVEILSQYEFTMEGEPDFYKKVKDILRVAYLYARR